MNRALRLCLGFAAAAFFVAFVGQTFLPQIGGTGTIWGLATGWQREIGFWNLGMFTIVMGVLRKGDAASGRIVVRGLLILGVLLGSNHLFALLAAPRAMAHFLPMIVNYAGVCLGWVALSRSGRDA